MAASRQSLKLLMIWIKSQEIRSHQGLAFSAISSGRTLLTMRQDIVRVISKQMRYEVARSSLDQMPSTSSSRRTVCWVWSELMRLSWKGTRCISGAPRVAFLKWSQSSVLRTTAMFTTTKAPSLSSKVRRSTSSNSTTQHTLTFFPTLWMCSLGVFHSSSRR